MNNTNWFLTDKTTGSTSQQEQHKLLYHLSKKKPTTQVWCPVVGRTKPKDWYINTNVGINIDQYLGDEIDT